ncbi:restriction endonuclease subunit S [Romboutsia sp. 1001216sp1]|uniref:restriction endonuclease subunit S n=1 Tax=Romboutsia sp. 1001216sp1 TaxID=2986997 RepID=UPI002330FF3C|nr:restriction endonuclease subunit S [Romboutsia sp. 1001216sp1]MDB8803602.1 restriction endonuclease subunit S [Romboutsia sp. 1001216sp1]MDB8807896.1 restriction endonuclease subunit S [Romboutsia sp. 1001216sp1]MDB8809250.1 restriction endonuclease subunit S [Romboutsia sp. 1001216sp1]MDB8814998.1 restriction endonuclease subunit S [Romboutsia sp. 1001216sp1]MDB8819731.1 restriction endonuclease subunit S [Romboutsia sp. 1001216sp1]
MSFKIKDICDINRDNLSKEDDLKYINYLDTSNLTLGNINELQKLIVGEDKIPSRAKRKVKVSDILISTVRPNQKHYGILKKVEDNMIVSTGFAVLTPNENIVNPSYLYNYLTQNEITEYLQGIAETSTTAYPSIKPSDIGNLEIDLPPIEEQKAIAKILSDIDDKIETNNKINKRLEEMASSIFKHWFVDFEFPNEEGKPYKSSGGEMVESELGMIPKGWEVKNIKDIALSANTGADAIRRAPIVEHNTGIRCVRVGDFTNNRELDSWGFCEISNVDYEKFRLSENDILITRTACIGLTKFIIGNINAVYNNGLIRLKVNDNNIAPYIYALLSSNDFMNYINRITGETSTRPNMKVNYVLGYKFILPSKNILLKFVQTYRDLLFTNKNISIQNEKLSNLRDTILPKLISGEIRVTINK